MTTVATSSVLAECDRAWGIVRENVDGLTDDELLWEPVPGCWTLRTWSDGAFHSDWSNAPIDPPFTTIGWRLAHIGMSLAFHARRLFTERFAGGSPAAVSALRSVLDDGRDAGTAGGAMRYLQAGYDRWRDGIAASGETLDEALALEVRRFNGHATHHASEIGVLRHLYRWSRPLDPDPFVDACLRGEGDRLVALSSESPESVRGLIERRGDLVLAVALMGRWHVIETLVDIGFPVDGGTGASALHHAAAYGPLDTVRRLVELGADIQRRDKQWDQTPLGWAEYQGNVQAAEYLRRL